MRKDKRFSRKDTVRFQLVPGVNNKGEPTVLYKPVENKASKVSEEKTKKIISQISDYDQITINGKAVSYEEIPAYVLEMIRGKNNLIYNQKREIEEETDQYELIDGEDCEEEEENDAQEYENEEGEEQWVDEELDEQEIEEQSKQTDFVSNSEQFPSLTEKVQSVVIEEEGRTYKLTKTQVSLLQQLIPSNYEQLSFGGLQFKKYSEDGLLLSEKHKYEQFITSEDAHIAVVDSFRCAPVLKDIVDNDLKPSQIQGEVKEIEEALEAGSQGDYEEMEDDFFMQMIQQELKTKQETAKKANTEGKKPKKTPIITTTSAKETGKQAKKLKVVAEEEQITDEMLDKAIEDFDNGVQNQVNDNKKQQQEDQIQLKPQILDYKGIESVEQYIGRDGELDWRLLSRKEKKSYMKTKVIREGYKDLREREISQKLKGKKNVTAEQLHLKNLVEHLTFEEDHVLRAALERDDSEEEQSESQSESDYDDIVSYHQRTSVISNNISVVQEPKKVKPKKVKQQVEEPAEQKQRMKVIPQQRKRDQTKQQRQQRKHKLKQMKKAKRQRQKQFADKFDKERKAVMKRDNPNPMLKRAAYVKIY